jgi:Mg2+ and Co2+ transporter CorA
MRGRWLGRTGVMTTPRRSRSSSRQRPGWHRQRRSLAAVRSWIDHAGEVVEEPSPSLVAQLVGAGQPFWLDIENPTDEVIDRLAAHLGLHPLAVEDSKQFEQRGKLQVYGTWP